MKRILAIGIILLFIGMSISSSTGFNVEKQSIKPVNGKTLYVGGSGPNNYTKIQDAIDNASDGDTVFVYDDSSPYIEYNILISKPLNLLGENRDTTIISWDDIGDIIIIKNTENVTISGFTIQHSTLQKYDSSGILIKDSNDSNISGNNFFYNNEDAIHIPTKCNNLTIIGNFMSKNFGGITHDVRLDKGKLKNCIIKDNTIKKILLVSG